MRNNEKRIALEAKKEHWRKILIGSNEKRGLLLNVFMYVLLTSIAFVFLYPVLYMFSTSLMPREDLLDSAVKWIPSSINLKNYYDAILTMNYWDTLLKNFVIAFFPMLAQVVVCSMVGYGLARFEIPGRKLWIVVLMLTFLLPPQVTMIPNYVLYGQLKLTGSIWAFLLPAALGMGFKSALFILIFYNFHRQVPNSLVEACEIDGTTPLGAYFRIAIPLSMPAIVVVILFSFVWYWNETTITQMYLGYASSSSGLTTLLLELQKFQASYESVYNPWEASPDKLNDAIRMAGTMISIAPLMILYFILQKRFVESVDKTGITGE